MSRRLARASRRASRRASSRARAAIASLRLVGMQCSRPERRASGTRADGMSARVDQMTADLAVEKAQRVEAQEKLAAEVARGWFKRPNA